MGSDSKRRQRRRLEAYARSGGRCEYCEVRLSIDDATLDHVVPRSTGAATQYNVVVACSPCNNRKGSQDWATFLASPWLSARRRAVREGRDVPLSIERPPRRRSAKMGADAVAAARMAKQVPMLAGHVLTGRVTPLRRRSVK